MTYPVDHLGLWRHGVDTRTSTGLLAWRTSAGNTQKVCIGKLLLSGFKSWSGDILQNFYGTSPDHDYGTEAEHQVV